MHLSNIMSDYTDYIDYTECIKSIITRKPVMIT